MLESTFTRAEIHRLAWLVIAGIAILSTAISDESCAFSNSDARLVLHLTTPVAKAACSGPQARPPCQQFVTGGQTSPALYYALVVLTNGSAMDGVSVTEFGVTYDDTPGSGVDVFSWTSCASNQIQTGGWPASGTGNRVTWSPCHTDEPNGPGSGVTTVAGYFYMTAYSEDEMKLTVHPERSDLMVASCSGSETGAYPHLPNIPVCGSAVFRGDGTATGWNPCLPYPVSYGHCAITGPRHIDCNGAPATFSLVNPVPGVEYHWFVDGEVSIEGPTVGTSLTLDALEPGHILISVSTMARSPVLVCLESAYAFSHVSVTPTTWSAVKRLVE